MIDSPSMSVWIGYDSSECVSFAIARHSILRFQRHIPVEGLVLEKLKAAGYYYRPTERRRNDFGKLQLWDAISAAWMSTEFSVSRFLVPILARTGWALFVDSDVMVRRNVMKLFALARSDKAVMCVKHEHKVVDGETKKDSQIQQAYARKNWSSVMLFNCDHPANKRLSVSMVNQLPGRELHRFCWLEDDEIGALPAEWNYLVNVNPEIEDPALVHFTEGLPDVEGYELQEYADEWRALKAPAVGAT